VAFAWARLRDGRRGLAWGALFFLLTLAPHAKVVPFSGNSLFNDRYLYLPSVGLIALLALPLSRVFRRGGAQRAAALASCALVVVACSAASWRRSQVWRTSESLWSSVIAVYPRTALAHFKLGLAALERDGDTERALARFETALQLDPGFAAVELRLGELHARRGDAEAARRHFERFVALAPRDVGGRAVVANYYAGAGDLRRAVLHFEAALAIKPTASAIHNNLGVVLQRLGEYERAEATLRRATLLDPEEPTAWANLGALYLEQKQRRKARRAYESAAQRGYEIDAALARRLGRGRRP
jgi:Tfp pilus assembly protein PilF